MIYKETKEGLIKEGLLKKCPVDYKAIASLLKRSFKDLKTAKRNLESDEECAFNYAYTGMLRAGLALMFSEGFRPEIKDKHLTIVRFASSTLGEDFKRLINDYDFMRKKRNRFIYEPDAPCTLQEARGAIKAAEEFIDKISAVIRERSPQKHFEF